MLLQNSFEDTLPSRETVQVVKQLVKAAKEPLLREIQKVKSRFQEKVKKACASPEKNVDSLRSSKIKFEPSLNSISSKVSSEKAIEPSPRILTESSCEECITIKKEPFMGEWTLSKDNISMFQKTEDMLQYYSKIFDRRIVFAQGKKTSVDSFKLQEKQVIQDIYNRIRGIDGSVEFDTVQRFFEDCPLFYRVYNIHPHTLRDVLADAAHSFQAKLTKEQFMNLFLLNNRQNYEYDTYIVDQTIKRCVLGDDEWKDLKQIFDLFDTFGNETIQLKQFLHKFKTSSRLSNLLNTRVLQFPTISRHYTLKKILFEIEHKLRIGDSYVKWQEIKTIIENFRHVKEPTIDSIQKDRICMGIITSHSNNYILRPAILAHVKEVFDRCPKYCHDFVKISHFCSEVLESEQTNSYLNEIVRNGPSSVTFKQSLTQLGRQPIKYFDLDQILEWFSIKGLESEIKYADNQRRQISVQSSSSDEQLQERMRAKEKEKKNIQNLPKKYYKVNSREITAVKEFNLFKKSKESIRDKKVQLMIEESKRKQQEEISKKFKAHPIPASINNEKYQEYKQKMSQNKEAILQKLNQQNFKERQLLQYLQANTRLFERPKSAQPQQRKPYVFKAEPIPWFVYPELLGQINQEKEEKRKEIKKQNRFKYLRDWKNLPSFILESNLGESATQINNQTEKTLFNQLKLNEEPGKESRRGQSKVKDVPNFQMLHKQFLEDLEHRKKHYKPTTIQEFHLSSPRVKENLPEKSSVTAKKSSRINKQKVVSANNFIGSTLKFQSMVQLKNEKRILQEIQRQESIQKEKKKQFHRQLFAKLVRKELNKEIRKQKKMKDKSKRTKSEQCKSQAQIAGIYRRVFDRPFLFQANTASPKYAIPVEKRAQAIQIRNQDESQIEYVEDIFPEVLQTASKLKGQADYEKMKKKSL